MLELSNLAVEFLDEILEILWVKLEEGGKESVSREEIVVGSSPVYEEPISVLEKKGLVKVEGDQIRLTDSGFEEARRTIRRHRLTMVGPLPRIHSPSTPSDNRAVST